MPLATNSAGAGFARARSGRLPTARDVQGALQRHQESLEEQAGRRSGVEWSGVEWSGVERSGAERSGVEWSGVE